MSYIPLRSYIWLWINTYKPIKKNISRGMNIHKSQLF